MEFARVEIVGRKGCWKRKKEASNKDHLIEGKEKTT
jgi:hypothetical protein